MSIVGLAGATTLVATSAPAGSATPEPSTSFATSRTVTGYFTPKAGVTTVTLDGPRSGQTGGGSTVTINGTRFTAAAKVMFGTTRGMHVVVKSATKITVHAPAHARATVDVRVRTPGGTSPKVRPDRYTYGEGRTSTQ